MASPPPDVGTGLMQELQDIAQFDQGANGNFTGSTNLSGAQNSFLTGEITSGHERGQQSQQRHRPEWR